MTAPLLPPAVAGWPSPLAAGDADAASPEDAAAALARIRAEALFWPAPRAGATRPRALALGAAALAEARAAFPDAEIARDRDPAAIDPERLEAVFAPAGPLRVWAEIGGLAPAADVPPAARLRRARGVSPWTGARLPLAAAVAAQALLRDAALGARGPVRLVGMTRWKRRCLRPFLTGPDGPPRPARRPETGGPVVVWGAGPGPEDALRVEDGFLRSVGLGLRHTPPRSLVIARGRPHFDATGPNAFDAAVAAASFSPELLARAAALRARVLALGLTKYNLRRRAALPETGGRAAVLVPGQVESDASIRLGATGVRANLALLEAARARFPDAFLLFKPHPDVETGLRPGHVPEAEARRFADAVARRAPIGACLDWADRVATITSLAGFEALLRGKAATTFGRPFYAGWGLTDDADPPPRARRLSLDELVAAALILLPRYADPGSGLPCPPEIAVEALAAEMAAARRPGPRLVRLWRDAISWTLNRL